MVSGLKWRTARTWYLANVQSRGYFPISILRPSAQIDFSARSGLPPKGQLSC
jgi:hypothetical protein